MEVLLNEDVLRGLILLGSEASVSVCAGYGYVSCHGLLRIDSTASTM